VHGIGGAGNAAGAAIKAGQGRRVMGGQSKPADGALPHAQIRFRRSPFVGPISDRTSAGNRGLAAWPDRRGGPSISTGRTGQAGLTLFIVLVSPSCGG
jgi:hypothetical protein